MSLFTGTNVCFGVGKQIVGTKGEQVELADLQKVLINSCSYILVVEVIALGYSNEERLVPIFAHELVEFLLDEIHLYIININYSTVALVFINHNCSPLSRSSKFMSGPLTILDDRLFCL